MRSLHTENQKGFSLVELMVALTIFSIIMTASIGTLLVLIDANGKAQAVSSSMTNLSFVLDSMTRNIRTGRDFYCGENFPSGKNPHYYPNPNDCDDGGSEGRENGFIVFTPGFESNVRMAYRLENGAIQQWVDDSGSTNDTWMDITSNKPPAEVEITDFDLSVQGSQHAIGVGDDEQPQISILLKGDVKNGLSEATTFNIQSTVTQRVLNY
jgi:prepilin-type N-terminal cleavage/methylation domain-containing protein